jgi:hypothetical protein
MNKLQPKEAKLGLKATLRIFSLLIARIRQGIYGQENT